MLKRHTHGIKLTSYFMNICMLILYCKECLLSSSTKKFHLNLSDINDPLDKKLKLFSSTTPLQKQLILETNLFIFKMIKLVNNLIRD